MKKIFLTIAVFLVSVALLHAQTDTMYVMKAGRVINTQSIKLADVDSISFIEPEKITPDPSIQTVLIPAGSFIMGSPVTEVDHVEIEPQHPVIMSAYRMCRYEITNTQFAAFLNAKSIGSDGKSTAGAYPTQTLIYASSGNYDFGLHYTNSQWIPVAGYENHPVVNVTWYGAARFATYVGGTLPTEAQWEYACRAGTTTPFSTGNFLTNLQANYNWEIPYNGGTNTVTTNQDKSVYGGTYEPNAFGVSDMHGNVSEWCSDWFHDSYGSFPTLAQINPTGPTTGEVRIYRGGSLADSADQLRSACRSAYYPSGYAYFIGFRVVFAP